MPHARPTRTVVLAAVLAAITVFFCFAAFSAPAQAGTRSVRVLAFKGGELVFMTRGVSATSVRSARLKSGRQQRSLRVSSIRRKMRRGKVRVRAPRSLRSKVRKLRRLRRAKAPVSVVRHLAAAVRSQAAHTTLVLATTTPRQPERAACPSVKGARFVSPSGDDSNPGTIAQPWKTIEKAKSAAHPGETIALRGGTYGAHGKITYFDVDGAVGAPINFVAYPGETPVFPGHVALDGDNLNVCGMLFDGPTGSVANRSQDNPTGEQSKVWIAGTNVTLQNSEIRGARWHAGVYIEANNARLIGNYIHDNGQFDRPEMANLDHGVYWSKGTGGLIEGNRFVHNYANAVSFYPEVKGVTVRKNVMTGQGRAAILLCEDVSNHTIEDNEIYGNRRGILGFNVTGRGNVARANHLWDNVDGNLGGDGIAFSRNRAR
jgi:hypothetical protein